MDGPWKDSPARRRKRLVLLERLSDVHRLRGGIRRVLIDKENEI